MTDACQNAAYAPARMRSTAGVFGQILQTLRMWQERAASRADLSHLDRRLLKDIALSDIDVRRETAKPFWRP